MNDYIYRIIQNGGILPWNDTRAVGIPDPARPGDVIDINKRGVYDI